MSASAAQIFFRNFTKMEQRVPIVIWQVLRVMMLCFTVAVSIALVYVPERALPIFWGLLIPILPMILVVAPGLWRQVCPMAFANQLPRMFNFSKAKDLPDFLKARAFSIAIIFFVSFVAMRAPLVNHAGIVLGIVLITAIVLAFVGGTVFKGRSGWCGTFCPLGPIQRSYGQAPLVVVRNGFCHTCVGCQKNCYDFNPRATVFSDVFDEDPRYAAQRRLFMGLLPGLVLGYFLQKTTAPDNLITYWQTLALFCAASVGFFSLLLSFTRIDPYRISLAFSAIALAIFYWFAGPLFVRTVGGLFSAEAPAVIQIAAQATGVLAALGLALSGWWSERNHTLSKRAASEAKFNVDIRELTRLPQSVTGKSEATDRETGASFPVAEGASLLDAIQTAGLKINYGCRSGFCGADAVAIIDGAANLSPPGEDEIATLRRMGLEGKARLACVCQVKGPVTFDRNPKAPGGMTPTQIRRAQKTDKAIASGIQKVVIVGNGVAGTTAAQTLRSQSLSVDITMVTNEPMHFYNRMAIGRLIYDPTGMEALQLVPETWFAENKVTVLRNTVATKIDTVSKRLMLGAGDALSYDKLILATGARAAMPAPDFLSRKNAFVLRSVDDAQSIRNYAQSIAARRAVVIGGGVLGVEVAEALQHFGLQVILLQRADRLMNAQLDETGSRNLKRYLENIGIQVVTHAVVKNFDGGSLIRTAQLSHGPRVSADLFVACLGVQPNLLLAHNAGLETGRGISVNAAMQTSNSDVLAIGDAAEPKGMTMTGLWPSAAGQAEVAVATIFGDQGKVASQTNMLRLKSEGIDVYSFGDIKPKAGDQSWKAHEPAEAWWTLVLRHGKPAGGIFVGPPGSGKLFAKLLKENAAEGAVKELLAMGLQQT